LNVVDLIATDLADLLQQVDGETVITRNGPQILDTKDLEIRELDRNLLEHFLGVITNPNLVFLFLTIGSLGILAELMTPGLIGPGVVGGIALALGFVGAGQMPVNWVVVALMLFAMILFFWKPKRVGWEYSSLAESFRSFWDLFCCLGALRERLIFPNPV
jgi:membrane-bound serine protease (ClpP class)